MSKTKFKCGIETPSKIIFESYGVKYGWQTNHSDLTLDEVLVAFNKLLIAHGFNEEGILESMRDYAEEQLEILESCKEPITPPSEDVHIYHTVLTTATKGEATPSTMADPFEGHTPYFEMPLDPTGGCSDNKENEN